MSDSPPSSVPSRFPRLPSSAAPLSSTLPTLPGPPSLPAAAWSDSDGVARAGGPFAGLVATPAELGAPTIGHIGRYALKYQLGAGGLGTVFAAHDPLLSRLIAVKTLNVDLPDDERQSFNAIFINEARAAGGLSHPHIVTVFDAGVSDDRAYIAMELLKGKDLRQLMQEGWRATPAQAVLIVRRVADALAYAHSKGVIHRDVKPANIFMVGRTQPRVLDFGIARVTHRHERDANAGAGSPYYMAPEQIRRTLTDRRADVFSLGVVLYELLTATKPFTGGSLEAIAEAVKRHEPPLVSKVDPAVPGDLAKIVARAMEKDPDQRFRSARSFARELRQWLDAHPAGPDAEAPVVAVAARRWTKPLVLVAGLTMAAAAATAAGVATWRAMQPETAATSATSPVVAPLPAPVVVVAPPAVAAVETTPSASPDTTEATAPAALVEPVAEPAGTTATAMPHPAPALRSAPVPSPAPAAAVVAAAKETARERRLREARERESLERDARAAVVAAVPSTGKVRIAISPWGLVEVDGAASGAAPPLTELVLAEGRHRIVVRNGDSTPFSTTVDVVGGETTSLRYKFP